MYPRGRRVLRTKRRLRRKTYRKKAVIPRNRYGQGKIYAFKRTCELNPFIFFEGAWTRSAGNQISNDSSLTLSSGIFKFKLDDLPGYTDFTNLYENFKLTGVKLKFIPFYGTESSGADGVLATFMMPLAICIDRGANDTVAGSPTFSQMLQNQDVKIKTTSKPFSVWISYPKAHGPADAVNQSTLMSPWLDTETFGQVVDHHGVKFAFQNTTTSGRSNYFRVFATYYVKCRAPQ